MQVQQDQIGWLGTGEIEACLALCRPDQADAWTSSQHALHQPPVRDVVLDVQDHSGDS
jgi:hypothetical protein